MQFPGFQGGQGHHQHRYKYYTVVKNKRPATRILILNPDEMPLCAMRALQDLSKIYILYI